MSEGTSILLASNSPRRRELMALGNWTFNLHVSSLDEAAQAGEAPADYVLRLAEAKARAAAAHAGAQQVIIGADTAVVDGQTLIGKPADAADAIQILKGLRGHSHQVYTGLAVLRIWDARLLTDLCVTDVPVRSYGDAEIDEYVASGDPFDKAGAYAIQHAGFRPVENLRGCYASVMGLPLCHLARLLARMDFAQQADLPANCQSHLGYACPVSSAILRGEQVG
jgi:septum formation protein